MNCALERNIFLSISWKCKQPITWSNACDRASRFQIGVVGSSLLSLLADDIRRFLIRETKPTLTGHLSRCKNTTILNAADSENVLFHSLIDSRRMHCIGCVFPPLLLIETVWHVLCISDFSDACLRMELIDSDLFMACLRHSEFFERLIELFGLWWYCGVKQICFRLSIFILQCFENNFQTHLIRLAMILFWKPHRKTVERKNLYERKLRAHTPKK